jgi:surfeit locus 1 family protein
MKFKRTPLLAYLCLLPVLLALGVWQLNRAEEKRSLLNLQKQQETSESLVLTADSPDSVDTLLYKTVKATGHYDRAHQILLDNQVYQGKAGYFVLTPFLLAHGNKAILINRGWVNLGKSRSLLPDVSVPENEITLSGRINRFPRIGLKIADAETTINNWPAVVQPVDIMLISKQLTYPLFSFQVELDTAEPNGFIRHWHQSITMTPEKHVGYAVQWFLLALTLTVLFIKYGIHKNNDQ